MENIILSMEFFFFEMLLPGLKAVFKFVLFALFFIICPFAAFIVLQRWTEEHFG